MPDLLIARDPIPGGRLVAAVERKTLATGGRDWTSPTYAAHFNISQATAWQDLTALVEAGALTAEGGRKGRRYRRAGEGGSGGDGGG